MEPDEHRREDRADVAFEEVCTHTGDIADVVADVIRNDRRVTRIVFWNSCFDFANQIRADVRRLRVDTASHTREERHHRGAESKTGQRPERSIDF